MGFIRKYHYEILAAAGILILYLILRLYQLTIVPIFTDEAIYLRWAQIALNDANWRFISLTDGKQPLFIWLTMVALKFVSDPLLAGRLISVGSGLVSVAMLYIISLELFKSKKVGLLAALAYVSFPFAQVYDRMALYDSLAGALTLISLYLAILLARKVRLDVALILGFSVGLGVLNKSTNFFSLYLLPFTLILFELKKKWMSQILKWVLFGLIAFIVAQGMYAILRLSPFFHMVGLKNELFIFPFSEWINHPFEFFVGNLSGLSTWLWEYMQIPYVALVIFAFVRGRFFREKLLLFLYFILPLLALALFARILFPRFIFFMTLSLLPLVGFSLNEILNLITLRYKKIFINSYRKALLTSILLCVFFGYPLFVSYQFATNPVNAPISKPDSAQYVNHWTAGWGVNESVMYLSEQASRGEVFIATEGTFGLLPFALELYLDQNPNIKIKGYWPLENELPDEVIQNSSKGQTYIIFYQPNNIDPPSPEHLELIQSTKQGKSDYYYRLYRVYGFD